MQHLEQDTDINGYFTTSFSIQCYTYFLHALCSLQRMLFPTGSWVVLPSEPENKYITADYLG